MVSTEISFDHKDDSTHGLFRFLMSDVFLFLRGSEGRYIAVVALRFSLLCGLRPTGWWYRLFSWLEFLGNSRSYFGGTLCGCCSAGTHYGISFGTTGAWHSAARSACGQWDIHRGTAQNTFPPQHIHWHDWMSMDEYFFTLKGLWYYEMCWSNISAGWRSSQGGNLKFFNFPEFFSTGDHFALVSSCSYGTGRLHYRWHCDFLGHLRRFTSQHWEWTITGFRGYEHCSKKQLAADDWEQSSQQEVWLGGFLTDFGIQKDPSREIEMRKRIG